MKDRIKAGDIIIICGVLLLSLVILCVSLLWGLSSDAKCLVVKYGNTQKSFSLETDTVFTIENNGYTLTVRIEDGCGYVESADCPDKTCVHTGKISRSGRVIACVPAGVTLSIAGEEAEYDFIAG